jgi:DNA-binding response OmpR family regulator
MSDTILIVDDSLTVRMDLADAFEEAGFSILTCADIAAARATLLETAVGLVVLDVVFPDGDGVEFLKELRAVPAMAQIPVLMLSSEAEVKDRIRGLKTGATEYVGKPYDTGYMIARIRELLHPDSDASGKATILIIDDSATYREELQHALQGAGYSVLSASNGEEGLQMAAGYRPSAIVVDGVMAGMDGATVIRRIRLDAALRDTPCLLLTASEDHAGELRALDAGADAFVRKEESFDIMLARLAAVLRSATAAGHGKAVSLMSPKKILAVDDSPTYLQELAEMLHGEGYDVVLARSGEEALEMLAVQSVDCILMDLLMPGMGGSEACRQIKMSAGVRDVPLIMLTSVDDRNSMIEGLARGADDFIQKSGEFEILKARLRAQIRRKQFEDEHRRIREELLCRELEAIEARAAQKLAETQVAHMEQLEYKNKELEAFNYSVSHDLRAPLRAIDGFSLALEEDCSEQLDEAGRRYLAQVRSSAQRMGELIEDMLALSRIGRAELRRERVDLSSLANEVLDVLQSSQPERNVIREVQPALTAMADRRLIRIALENLLGNAWKFTSKTATPRIMFGCDTLAGEPAYFVRDNGAGFNAHYAEKLFKAFQRLHSEAEFPGTGIGLATVHRVIDRHGGRIWAEGCVDLGASFFFTIPSLEAVDQRTGL